MRRCCADGVPGLGIRPGEGLEVTAAADAFATERIGRIGRVRLYWTPGGRGWAKIWGAR